MLKDFGGNLTMRLRRKAAEMRGTSAATKLRDVRVQIRICKRAMTCMWCGAEELEEYEDGADYGEGFYCNECWQTWESSTVSFVVVQPALQIY